MNIIPVNTKGFDAKDSKKHEDFNPIPKDQKYPKNH